jgi:deazaflavin-dependent oxidoreductase (nitroreductase family)
VPSDFLFKTTNVLHKAFLRASGGRVGGKANGMPVVELVTTGRRSGQERAVILTSPIRDGEAWVVVASRSGDDRHPAWFLNVRDEPRVSVAVRGGPRVPMRASVATADERARLWPRVVADFPHYAKYQERTEREIPLVLLRPETDPR